jgi:hypothetical protein
MATATLEVNDEVHLGDAITNTSFFGHVTDLDSPNGVVATLEILGDQAVLSMDVLIGPQGIPGKNASPVKMQWQDSDSMDTPSDLPGGATGPPALTPAEEGYGYWIGNQVYVWSGNAFYPFMMGTKGLTGLTPDIDPTIEDIPWMEVDRPPSTIEVSGTADNPQWHFKIAAPRGAEGPASAIRLASDYNNTIPPSQLQVPAWHEEDHKFHPESINLRLCKMYTVPEGQFVNFSGLSQRQTICTFAIPPQDYDWVPWVVGHIRASGLEIDTDPLIIGAEVRLGDPQAGQLVARGFGNNSTWTTITPHASTAAFANDAITPEGLIGRVPANHTGNEGTVYVNLYNDGITGVYNFAKNNAQLGILVVPL